MTTLDDAIAAHMAHGAAAQADMLTDSMLDQLLPLPPAAPTIRAGWEDEPIAPPIPWVLYTLVLLASIVLSALLSGCGGGGDEADYAQPGTQPVDCVATPERCK